MRFARQYGWLVLNQPAAFDPDQPQRPPSPPCRCDFDAVTRKFAGSLTALRIPQPGFLHAPFPLGGPSGPLFAGHHGLGRQRRYGKHQRLQRCKRHPPCLPHVPPQAHGSRFRQSSDPSTLPQSDKTTQSDRRVSVVTSHLAQRRPSKSSPALFVWAHFSQCSSHRTS